MLDKATVAKRVTGLDDEEAWSTTHAKYSTITLCVQRERMYPNAVKGRESSGGGDDAVGRNMKENDDGAWGRRGDSRSMEKIPALLEMCLTDVKDETLMNLDEIGGEYENLKTKVISYSSNKWNSPSWDTFRTGGCAQREGHSEG